MLRGLLILALILCANIVAQAKDISAEYNYEVYWSGFEVAGLKFSEEQNDANYEIVVEIDSRSIAKYFSKYSSINQVSGFKKDGEFVPQVYHSKWWRRDEKQDIELVFSGAGDVTKETLVPPERVGKRPEVGSEYKVGVFDPVTAAIVSRETIRKKLEEDPNFTGDFTVPTFDAKRRFDVICSVKGYEQINVNGESQRLLRASIERKPVAGFRERDLKEMREQNQIIDFYLNDNFVPVYGVAKAQVGRATIKLVSSREEAISVLNP